MKVDSPINERLEIALHKLQNVRTEEFWIEIKEIYSNFTMCACFMSQTRENFWEDVKIASDVVVSSPKISTF